MRSEPDAYLKGLPVRIQDYTFADVGPGLALLVATVGYRWGQNSFPGL
jgi:hypothetical protein